MLRCKRLQSIKRFAPVIFDPKLLRSRYFYGHAKRHRRLRMTTLCLIMPSCHAGGSILHWWTQRYFSYIYIRRWGVGPDEREYAVRIRNEVEGERWCCWCLLACWRGGHGAVLAAVAGDLGLRLVLCCGTLTSSSSPCFGVNDEASCPCCSLHVFCTMASFFVYGLARPFSLFFSWTECTSEEI